MKEPIYIPYVGITDFTNYGQVQHMLEVFQSNLKREQDRRLHIGVMMSRKTLNGIASS